MKLRKQLSDKAKVWILVSMLLLFLAASVFFWLRTKTFINGCWHWIGLYILEWGARASQGRFLPPLFNTTATLWKRIFKRKSAPIIPPKTIIRITTISEWLVTDMLKCSYYQDFSSIGEGNPEALLNQYNKLIYQYIDAKGDPQTKQENELRKKQIILNGWDTAIRTNIEILKLRYSPAACKFLREDAKGKMYPKLPFTFESYLNDLPRIEAWLISLGIDIDRNNTLLAKSQTAEESRKYTYEQKEEQMQDLILAMNRTLSVSYKLRDMYVSELAAGEKALNREYKRIEEQIKKSKK